MVVVMCDKIWEASSTEVGIGELGSIDNADADCEDDADAEDEVPGCESDNKGRKPTSGA